MGIVRARSKGALTSSSAIKIWPKVVVWLIGRTRLRAAIASLELSRTSREFRTTLCNLCKISVINRSFQSIWTIPALLIALIHDKAIEKISGHNLITFDKSMRVLWAVKIFRTRLWTINFNYQLLFVAPPKY